MLIEHLETGTNHSWEYSLTSDSIYVETVDVIWRVSLLRGEWSIKHERTSGSGTLEIGPTIRESHNLDLFIIYGLWGLAGFLALIGLCTIPKYHSNHPK